MTVVILLWHCALSVLSRTFLFVQYLVQPFHNIFRSCYQDCCESALGRPNNSHHLFNDNTCEALLPPTSDGNIYTTNPKTGVDISRNDVPVTHPSDAQQLVTPGTNKSNVTQQQSSCIITTTASGQSTLSALHPRIVDPTKPIDADAALPRRDRLESHSILVNLNRLVFLFSRSDPLTPINVAVPIEHFANSILEQLHKQFNQPNLLVSKAVGRNLLNFQYFICFETGYFLAGRSNSAPCFWIVHGPAPTSGGTSAPASGRGNGKQRSGTGSRKTSGGGVGKPGRASNKGNGRNGNKGNGSNGNNSSSDEDGYREVNGVATRCYACPFYKFDPFTHYRCYRKYELRRPIDVKQHILRCHTIDRMYCSNCWRSWGSTEAAEFNVHTAVPSCDRVPGPEDLLPYEATELTDMVLAGSSGPAKWYLMWEALFKGHQPPESPYMDCTPQEIPSILRFFQENVSPQPSELTVYLPTLNLSQPLVPRYRRQQAISEATSRAQPPAHLQPVQQAMEQQTSSSLASGVVPFEQTMPVYPQHVVNDGTMPSFDEILANIFHHDGTREPSAGDPHFPFFPSPEPPAPPG